MDTAELISTSQQIFVDFGYRIAAAAAVFILGRWAAKFVASLLRRTLRRANVEDTLERFLCNLLNALLLTIVVIVALSQLGVETASVIAVLGAAGLAVGLALQGSLSNFAAGVLIVAFRPYRVGDFIEAAGTAGTVTDVQIFTTVLKTGDNKRVIVPNSQIMNGTIVNFSANDTRRVEVIAGCGYDDDLDKVRAVLEAIVAEDERILDEPAPVIAVQALADSSVNFVVRPWVKSGDFWPVTFDLNEKIKKRFDAEGLSIPYPQRDVHLYQHGPTGD